MEFAEELEIQEAKIRENYISGFIEDRENFLKELALRGFVFSVRNSKKLKPQILTKYGKGDIPIDIRFAFQKNEHTVYDCAHGPKYYKSSNTHEDHITLKKKRFRLVSTKKMNCEATLKIITLTYYPAYPVPENCSWTEKKKIIQQINRNTEGRKRYYLTMSVPSIHNHATTTTFLSEPVNNETQYVIRKQVNKANTNMHLIRDIIVSHGTTCSFDDLPPKYENSPFLTVDPLCDSFNTETNIISPEVPIVTLHELPLPPTICDSNNKDYPEKNSHCREEIEELQIVLKSMMNTTYLIRDSANINNLLRIKNKLQTLHTELKKEVRYDEGLITVPAVVKRKSHEKLLELPRKKKKSKCTVPNVGL